MLLKKEPPRHRQLISLTALIDVVFILLLFFMLTSTFMNWRQIDVSAASESESQEKELRYLTLLNDNGEFKIDNLTVNVNDRTAVQTIVEQSPDAVYVINVESGVHTQGMIDLLDAFKTAGAAVTLAGIN